MIYRKKFESDSETEPSKSNGHNKKTSFDSEDEKCTEAETTANAPKLSKKSKNNGVTVKTPSAGTTEETPQTSKKSKKRKRGESCGDNDSGIDNEDRVTPTTNDISPTPPSSKKKKKHRTPNVKTEPTA